MIENFLNLEQIHFSNKKCIRLELFEFQEPFMIDRFFDKLIQFKTQRRSRSWHQLRYKKKTCWKKKNGEKTMPIKMFVRVNKNSF